MEIITGGSFAQYLDETDLQQKIKSSKDFIEAMRLELDMPRVKPVVTCWRKTHEQLQFRDGEITIWGGANGSGKSLITGQIALSLMGQGIKCLIASFEMKPAKTLERMCRQLCDFSFKGLYLDDDEYKKQKLLMYEALELYTENKLWIYDQQGTVDWRDVLGAIKYAAQNLEVKHFFIDNLMKCVAGEDDYNGQKEFVDNATSVARDCDVHIHIVHHINKGNHLNVPSKYDLKGSGAIIDLADNVLTVWRNKPKELAISEGKGGDVLKQPDMFLTVDKQRNGDFEGRIGLNFHARSQQFINVGTSHAIDFSGTPFD